MKGGKIIDFETKKKNKTNKNKDSKLNPNINQNSAKNSERRFVKKNLGSEMEKTIEAKEFVPTTSAYASISHNL